MFTGLVEQTGTIVDLESRAGARRITIAAPGLAARLHEGDSVAVSGVCLTALDITADRFHADLAQETVERTSLIRLQPGAIVNLELPTPAGTPLGGHIVQGHVDATGEVVSLTAVNPNALVEQTDWTLKVRVPEAVARYVVEKGSIAIEGISLTVARWDAASAIVTIAIIPHTWARTNLHKLQPGDPVNLEADVIMKFAAEQARAAQAQFAQENSSLTVDFLLANGY
jgi:riboflavin synthase